ncbi:MAG TPA: cytochrome P450, partial [Trebonia sp.]
WFEAPTMISTDGADHVRLRKCLAPMFTRRATARWEQRVDAVVEQLLAPLAAGDSTRTPRPAAAPQPPAPRHQT